MKYTTTWLKGMNTRPTPSVSNAPNGTVPYGETVDIAEVWTASIDGSNVRKGDIWARLDKNITQWVAVIHLGVRYGVLSETPPPEPTPIFPESFELVQPNGAKALYTFVGIIK